MIGTRGLLIKRLLAIIIATGLTFTALSKTSETRKISMPSIIMYSTATCPYCERARQLFKLKKVPFEEIRVDAHPEKREEMIAKSHRSTVPQIFIDAHHVGGCDDLYALDADGRLDKLLKQG